MVDTLNATSEDTLVVEAMEGILGVAKDVLLMSDEARQWIRTAAYVGLVASVFYVLAGFLLLIKSQFSIRVVYGALVLMILVAIGQGLTNYFAYSGGFTGVLGSMGTVISVLIDGVFLAIVFNSDHSAYPVSDMDAHETQDREMPQ